MTRPFELGICLWTQATPWPEILAAAEEVDALGFDHLWTIDHLLAPQGEPDQAILEGSSVLAGWATRTRQTRLGLFVGANPFRSPTMVAKIATTVDHMSGGRAMVGLGAGWFEREHEAYGIEFGASPGERIAWLDESAGLIRRLLDGERVSHDGAHYRTDDLLVLPRPIQARVPLVIGGSGPRKTLRTVAKHADIWNAQTGHETTARSIGILREHCEAVARDPSDILLTVGANVIIRDDRAAAEDIIAEQLKRNGATPESSVTNPETLWLEPVDAVVERLRVYRDMGIGGLIVEMPAPYDMETIRLLASEVRPRLAD